MKISIIIPVYNAQQYLEDCLESIFRQTLQELEIICIDDGSTDKSPAILRKYKEKDERIKIIRQTNQGAGAARNRGLSEAAGEFIAFLDADDLYMDESALGDMYELCIANSVKVCGSALRHLRHGVITEDTALRDVKMAANETTILHYGDFQFDYGYTGFLFSSEMLIGNKINFPLYRRFQDPPFLVQAMYTAGQFVFSDAALYLCRVPTMASRFSRDKVRDLLMGLSDNLFFAGEKKLDKLFQTSLMRLEYEYYSVICHFASFQDRQILDLLWKINHCVRSALNDNEYMVRPLPFILSEDENFYQHYEKDLCKKIRELPYIYLYGAGGLARKFILYLKENGLAYKIKGIIVSEWKESNTSLEGISVHALNRMELKDSEYIFIAAGAVFHKEIVDSLKGKGFHQYTVLDSVFLEELPE